MQCATVGHPCFRLLGPITIGPPLTSMPNVASKGTMGEQLYPSNPVQQRFYAAAEMHSYNTNHIYLYWSLTRPVLSKLRAHS